MYSTVNKLWMADVYFTIHKAILSIQRAAGIFPGTNLLWIFTIFSLSWSCCCEILFILLFKRGICSLHIEEILVFPWTLSFSARGGFVTIKCLPSVYTCQCVYRFVVYLDVFESRHTDRIRGWSGACFRPYSDLKPSQERDARFLTTELSSVNLFDILKRQFIEGWARFVWKDSNIKQVAGQLVRMRYIFEPIDN